MEVILFIVALVFHVIILYIIYIKHISVHNNTLAHSNIMNNQGSESMSKSDIDYENKVEFSTEDVLELFST